MNETINEKVSVIVSYDREKGIVMPKKMRWQGRDYLFVKMTYHHRLRTGRVLLHIFHVTDGATDFRLKLDTETLQFTLEEVCDGTAT